ncbi:MAG: ATP-dependent dethiobiotin synthetase BioD, partial [Burkholderiales bacterium]
MTGQASGVFVTGTDTGVGKTEVACALLRMASRMGWRAVGMKPVAAGARRVRGRWRNADVVSLGDASGVRVPNRLRNPYLLLPPVAPHIAAREAGIELQIGAIVRAYR